MTQILFTKILLYSGLSTLASGNYSTSIIENHKKNNVEPTRPNVLFICAEDLSPRFGCYDDKIAITPHLDSLARNGIVFKNAYCNASVCNPSRTSFLTGLRPETTAVVENFYNWRKFVPDSVTTLPEMFSKNGYESVLAGKMFHYEDNSPKYWTKILERKYNDNVYTSEYLTYPEIPLDEKYKALKDTNFHPYLSKSFAWGTSQDEESTPDRQLTSRVCEFIESEHEKPFFLAVGFKQSHYPITAPKKYADLYDTSVIELPYAPADDLDDIPEEAYWLLQTVEHDRINKREWKEILKIYYGGVSFLDNCVGRMLHSIERTGLEDNTIIVFFSDHGLLLGEHKLWRKEVLFKDALQVPLIIKVPDYEPSGKNICNVVELLDLYPTLADLCNIKKPEHLEGRSLVDLFNNPDDFPPSSSYAIVKQGDREDESIGRSIINNEWHYIEWDDDINKCELYDLKNDPGEFNNLAGDEKCKPIIEGFHQQLKYRPLNKMIYELKSSTRNE